jgi:hypothetical protein
VGADQGRRGKGTKLEVTTSFIYIL